MQIVTYDAIHLRIVSLQFWFHCMYYTIDEFAWVTRQRQAKGTSTFIVSHRIEDSSKWKNVVHFSHFHTNVFPLHRSRRNVEEARMSMMHGSMEANENEEDARFTMVSLFISAFVLEAENSGALKTSANRIARIRDVLVKDVCQCYFSDVIRVFH